MNSRTQSLVFAAVAAGLTAVLASMVVSLATPKSRGKSVGLLINDPRAWQGYTLLAPIFSTDTFLIDMSGRVVKTWKSDHEPGQVAYLLDNGHLLRAGSLAQRNRAFRAGGGTGGRIQEFAWDGTIVWDFEYSSDEYLLHHDVLKLPGGNILAIAWERKTAQQAVAAGRNPALQRNSELWPDTVIEIAPTGKTTGEIVWKWKVWDHLIQDLDQSKPDYGDVARHPERIDLNHSFGWTEQLTNKELEKLKSLGYLGSTSGAKQQRSNPEWTHINAISYNARFDQIALSVLGFNELWIIDHSTTMQEASGHSGGRGGKGGDLLYRWGNPQAYRSGKAADQRLFAQHNVQWIPPGLPGEGHLLVFNNGRRRPDGEYSSVDEIVTPVSDQGQYSHDPGKPFAPDKPVWTYTAPGKTQFYSMHISGAQRLANGNTLVCSGANGTLFEVTPGSDVVWKYVNPVSRQQRQDGGKPQQPGGGPPKPGTRGDSNGGRPGGKDESTNTVFRVYRYAPDFPGLAGKDLTPHASLEESISRAGNSAPVAVAHP